MSVTRLKLITAGVLLFIAAAGGFAWFKYKAISAYIGAQASGHAARKLGRQVKIGKISFSLLEGVSITDACVSRRPDFSKGDLFCADKITIRPRLTALLRNRVYFSRIYLEKPVLKVREVNGNWDFADLLALLPETDKEIYLTWNANELTMRNAVLEADLQSSGLSFALENASLTLTHFSNFGGNYGLKTSGVIKSAIKGKLLSALVNIKTEANFDYGGLASTEGEFTATDASYGAIELSALEARWKLFNLREPLPERNYSGSLAAKKLFIPGGENTVKTSVAQWLRLFSAAMGKAAPSIEDIEMASLFAAFKLDNSVLSISDIALRANFITLDAALSINGPAVTTDAAFEAAIGANKIKLSASGPLSAPEIKPLLSTTLTVKFKRALTSMETGLLKIFPVTQEK